MVVQLYGGSVARWFSYSGSVAWGSVTRWFSYNGTQEMCLLLNFRYETQ
jgi:hypothetical protein